jgi:hypothetical protein
MMWFKISVIFFSIILGSNAGAFDTLRVTAGLDSNLKQITGKVEYNTPGGLRLPTFEFQLFPNVYSSPDTPYFVGELGLKRRLKNFNKWGGMTIDSILVDGENCSSRLSIDYTRGTLALDEVGMIKSPLIELYFKTTIPESADRLSYDENNYLLGGWFPFPAILQNDKDWYQPKYGQFSELVSDYFFYDVIFMAPSDLTIIGPGSSLIDSVSNNGITQYHFIFGPAHDFVLALGSDYLIDETVSSGKTIRVHYRDFEQPIVPIIRRAVSNSLEFMINNVGEYPYNSINCVFSNIGFSGGIEFPGLIAFSSPIGAPGIANVYDLLAVHETVHQWFYGIIGSNQVEDPWLDESVANLFTLKIINSYLGEDANLFDLAGLKVSVQDMFRLNAQVYWDELSLSQPTYSFTSGDRYFSTVYDRGALTLETLDNLLGDSLSSLFWTSYYRNYKFAHPTPEDFRMLLKTFGGDELADIFDFLIHGSETIDYSVSDLYNERSDLAEISVNFILHRKGRIKYSIPYRVYLSDGDSLNYEWLPEHNTEKISHIIPAPAISVMIDPDGIFAIDANLMNNSILVNSDNRPGFRLSGAILYLVESLFSFAGGI